METIDRLGKYEIKRIVGSGAMGTVYEGWDPSIQRHVAIKTVKIIDDDEPETREQIARFRREAQAAGRLVHPNIVTVYDYGESAGVEYIVMEYIEGPTLKSLLSEHERFALPDILRIMQDLLAGLEFSHDRGVVHRDIKPANLMLTSTDRAKSRVKIADFGIARIESSSMTQAGTMMGTPTYMSPEQFMGQTVDARTDIYSSGVVLYQLLTGERPFDGGLSAIMHKALHTEPPAPSQLSNTAPPALDAVVRKAMAKRPADRYASAAAFSAALLAAAAAPTVAEAEEEATMVAAAGPAAITAPAPAAPMPMPAAAPRKGNMVPVLAAVGVVGVLAAGGGAFFLLHAPDVPVAPVSIPAAPAPQTDSVRPIPAPVALPASVPPSVPVPDAASIRTQMGQIAGTQRCALLDGSVRDDATILVTGIAGPGTQTDLHQALAQRGISDQVQWQATTVDPVFCPALEVLQPLAPPFGAVGPRVALTLAGNKTVLHDGDRILPRVVMPDFAGYVRVDYIAHDGNVQHLYPQVGDGSGTVADVPRVLAPGERLSLGDPKPGQAAWEIAEPYGTDMIVAIVSSQPLFDRPRPGNVEPAADYVRDLDAAVQSLRGGGAKLAGAALLVDALAK